MDDTQLKELIRASNGRITIEDLQLLQRVCEKYKPKNILEIGSADGGSSVILGLAAKKNDGTLFCIEPQLGLDRRVTQQPDRRINGRDGATRIHRRLRCDHSE